MMQLLVRNDAYGFELHRSELIVAHEAAFVDGAKFALGKFDLLFPNKSSTWTFQSYNTFALTAGIPVYHRLYHELMAVIRGFAGHGDPLWFQSWINFHRPEEVLKWHGHRNCVYHGYISIRPHRTKTVFEAYEIANEVGNLYITRQVLKHKVEVVEPFDSPRITIAFDVFNERNIEQIYAENKYVNLSVLPV